MKTQIDPTQYTAHKHPGKFEGESAATEYFWEELMNGQPEDNISYYGSDDPEADAIASADLFRVNAEESEAFDLPIGATFMLREDSQGFVYGSVHASRAEAETKFRNWLGLPGLQDRINRN